MGDQNDKDFPVVIESDDVSLTSSHTSDETFEKLDDVTLGIIENQTEPTKMPIKSLSNGDADFFSVESLSFKTPSVVSDDETPFCDMPPKSNQNKENNANVNVNSSKYEYATIDDSPNESEEQQGIQYLGQMDAESGKLITDPERIFEFITKMPDLSNSNNEHNKFPIPMNPDGDISVIELDSSSEEIQKVDSQTDKQSFQSLSSIIVVDSDDDIKQLSNNQQPTSVVEIVDDEDSTQYEDIVEITTTDVSTIVDTLVNRVTMEEEDDDDFIEETIAERLWGLTEMLPESVIDTTANVINNAKFLTDTLFDKTRAGMWLVMSSLVVIAFPVVLGVETIRMDETQMAQQRQMLVNSGALNAQPGSLEPSPIIS